MLKRFFRDIIPIFKSTSAKWFDRDPIANSSTIAYCTIFSLPGLLVIVINIAGYFYDRGEVTAKVSGQIGSLMGKATAQDILSILEKVDEQKKTIISSILSFATLLIGATGVFVQLQKFLNNIWEVPPPEKQKFLRVLKDRLFSFGLILAVGFLLLVSLILSTVLATLSGWVAVHLSESLKFIFKALDILFSFGIITILFASIYKFLPDTKIRWRDVWAGAFVTSLLFVIAKFALGIYFGQSKPESAYGAAGSIVLVMLWVSYSSVILLFGAEFTHEWNMRKSSGAPSPNALE